MFLAATAPHPQLRRQAYTNAGRSLERFMDDALRTTRSQPCTYQQDDHSFTFSMDVPGIAKDQLVISIEGAVVHITSKKEAPRNYRAAYELPQEIDTASSEAKLENGVLTLKLAKKVPANNATELTIL
jgi:HSP20 family molecular chaperone IbpA